MGCSGYGQLKVKTVSLKMEARRIGWERFVKESSKEDRMVLWKENDSIVQAE